MATAKVPLPANVVFLFIGETSCIRKWKKTKNKRQNQTKWNDVLSPRWLSSIERFYYYLSWKWNPITHNHVDCISCNGNSTFDNIDTFNIFNLNGESICQCAIEQYVSTRRWNWLLPVETVTVRRLDSIWKTLRLKLYLPCPRDHLIVPHCTHLIREEKIIGMIRSIWFSFNLSTSFEQLEFYRQIFAFVFCVSFLSPLPPMFARFLWSFSRMTMTLTRNCDTK